MFLGAFYGKIFLFFIHVSTIVYFYFLTTAIFIKGEFHLLVIFEVKRKDISQRVTYSALIAQRD